MNAPPQTAADFWPYLLAAKARCDETHAAYDKAIKDDAQADDDARKAKARAYLTAKSQLGSKATVPEIQAVVDLETANDQYRARLAEGQKRSMAMAHDSARQWLSSLQSFASLQKAEMALAKWEPSEVSA